MGSRTGPGRPPQTHPVAVGLGRIRLVSEVVERLEITLDCHLTDIDTREAAAQVDVNELLEELAADLVL